MEGRLLKQIRAGDVSISVFENELERQDGEKYHKKTFLIQRSYADREGNWKNTNNYNIKDITKLEVAIDELKKFIYLFKEKKEEAQEIDDIFED